MDEPLNMDESSYSVSLDVDSSPWGGQEHMVPTSFGPISVQILGDQTKPALITYPDVALSSVSCFEGFFSCPEASSLLLHNFCIYHIDPPGHEPGASKIPDEQPMPSCDDLADQVAEVLDYFGIHEVIGLGVTAGAYILTLLALKYRERVLGLILVSPICQAPSWTEWIYNKALTSLIYFCGMTNFVKESLLQRYFGQEARETEVMGTYRRVLEEGQTQNILRFMQAIHQRKDLSPGLRKLKCRTLIIVGEQSPFHFESRHVSNEMDRRYNALIEIQACGSLVTEEQPHSMLVPIEYFLMGYGFFRPPQLISHSTPTSPLSPPCIPSDLLSPESLGLKLKPIKTRVSLAVEEC
ncbi:hypothetical protein R1sor_018596 [Riccia sorocarpa]|uniref:Uncharacterized protein n=1 Tax=Riccia sorocarpa TaxID=122646 RepID=A0ABD3IDF7_9MARC